VNLTFLDINPNPSFRESGNPDAVPAEAGVYHKETGYLFAQDTLELRPELSRTVKPGMTNKGNKFMNHCTG
jgi:hypothetical protein